MKIIGYITTTILLLVFVTVLRGFVLAKLWAWFICSTFGLHPLTLPQAVGICGIIGYFSTKVDGKKDERKWTEIMGQALGGSIGLACMCLLLGWITKLFL
jgi:hypothetical protein